MKNIVYLFLLFPLLLMACAKSSFLDKKPNSLINVPQTLEDLQALLDNEKLINQHTFLGTLSADEYYFTNSFYDKLPAFEQYTYTWSEKLAGEKQTVTNWSIPYQQVNVANQVLEKLEQIKTIASNQTLYDEVKGTALFIRSYAFYNLAQEFAMPYDSLTAVGNWGIALRLDADVSIPSTRANLQQTYNQIIQDLKTATTLLSAHVSAIKSRPSAPAAWAILARTWLSMRDYQNAAEAADKALLLYDSLLDFNQLDTLSEKPFPNTNPEVIFMGRIDSKATSLLVGFDMGGCFIDSAIYHSYLPGDLRRPIYFKKNKAALKSSYYGDISPFTGLAIDELYLIRAECYARQNNPTAALHWLNRLLTKRWQKDRFVPLTLSNTPNILTAVLTERSKELVLRGQRWTDIRRLRLPLKRLVNGQYFHLPPDSKQYALPIPEEVIRLTGMPQNPR